MRNRISSIGVSIIIAAVLGGCAGFMFVNATLPPPDAGPYTVALDAHSLEGRVVVAVSRMGLRVLQNSGGIIITSPEKFPGPERGVLWWKKRWQERTSYEVLVLPTRNGNEFNIEVYANTEQRPNENYEWKPAASSNDKERAGRLLQRIIGLIGGTHVG